MDELSARQESCFSGDPVVDLAVLVLNLVLVGYVLYAFHVICDGYFVPALQILCTRNKIPDVIGGATIMAAGASSPELITNAVSLFALKSNVGTGTVVGSELFNMLAISGASVLVVGKELQLDGLDLSRELFFYLLSILLLFTVIRNGLISKLDALMLVAMYIIYVLTCCYWVSFRKMLEKVLNRNRLEMVDESSMDSPLLLKSEPILENELVDHNHEDTLVDDENGIDLENNKDVDEMEGDESNTGLTTGQDFENNNNPGILESRLMLQAIREQQFAIGKDWVLSGEFLGFDYGEVLMHGWLKKRVRRGLWVRRWFSIHPYGICQCRDPMQFGKSQMKIRANKLKVSDVSVSIPVEDTCSFVLKAPRKTYFLRAPNSYIRDKWVEAIEDWLNAIQRQQDHSMESDSVTESMEQDENDEDESDHHTHDLEILIWPTSVYQWLCWVCTFPILLPLWGTLPSPRKRPNLYMITITLSALWLAVCSFLLASSADTAGCLMNISSAVIGLTVGAAGTSLPNMFASMMVAKQGYADMAISNAFGSNIFNIFIALGVPWFIQVWFVDPSHKFKLHSSDITKGIQLLVISFIIYSVILILSKWRLTVPVGYLCIGSYIAYLIYTISL